MLAGWRRNQTSLVWPVVIHSIRCSSTSSSGTASPTELRQLMRKVAQPVAVITANLHDAGKVDAPDHGATVSSFVSIALFPTPFVAFALRLPSRLATFLNSAGSSTGTTSPPSPSGSSPDQPTFKIHLLSEEQEDVARAFARQAPLPNKALPSDTQVPHQPHQPFSKELFQKLEYASLGSLECSLAGDLPLVEPLFNQAHHNSLASDDKTLKASKSGQATSQLFIAKVHNVYQGDTSRHPLLYYHQKYSVLDMD